MHISAVGSLASVLVLVLLAWAVSPLRSAPPADANATREKLLAIGVRAEYPLEVLENAATRAYVYLPDAEKGYYRSCRFDWSGMIGQVVHDGKTYFAEIRTEHDPANPEHSVGPAEQFAKLAPLGFADAKPGETFVAIGIGHCVRPDDKRYSFFRAYEVRPAPWTVTKGERSLRFAQTLSDERGWGYEYVKELRLAKDKPVLEIFHSLRNTGTRVIETDWYAHNTFRFQDAPVGSGYRIVLPFRPAKNLIGPTKGVAAILDNEVVFPVKTLAKPLWIESIDRTGYRGKQDSHFRVVHDELGMALNVALDAELSQLSLYAEPTLLCPEPTIQLQLAPGATAEWTMTLRFETFPPPRRPAP